MMTSPSSARSFLVTMGLLFPFVPASPAAEKMEPPGQSGQMLFQQQIRPILVSKCLACHGPDKKKGGLDLSRRATALVGGVNGPALEGPRPEQSLLFQKVAAGDMPPRNALPPDQISAVRKWLEAGAPYTEEPLAADVKPPGLEEWALRPVTQPALPHTRFDSLATSPIDLFLFVQQEKKGLTPAPPANRLALLRRVTFDLTGLPPSPEEVNSFLLDNTRGAYLKVVDRLLASPAYGERWGRHWLDVVRFGESNGYEPNHLRPNAWPYRDYVIRSFNEDKPYPRFIEEQLAGDLLAAGDPKIEPATGFLVAGVHDTVGIQTEEGTRQQRSNDLDDMVSTIGATFLGLTVGCAKCHDHKFDPIPQKDYYRLTAVVAGVRHGERPVSALAQPGSKTATPLMAYLGQFNAPDPVYVLKRGDVMQRGEAVTPGALSKFPGLSGELELDPKVGEAGRRLALARWLANPNNPLTARVMVNRVWQYHFGRGIVGTPSDFGRNGEKPSHLELLNWLASDFMAHGWQLKRLHRLIVTSYTYAQSSDGDSTNLALDAGDQLLGRMPLRRLEAEAVRDAILAVSGKLDRRLGGPGFRLFGYRVVNVAIYEPLEEFGPETWRRSVYRQVARANEDDLLAGFDCPESAQRTPRRDVTITPLQSLSLLNGSFVVQQASFFAQRVQQEVGVAPEAQVDRAFLLAFGRAAGAAEHQDALELLKKRGLPALCRALLNANEFLYY